MMKKFIYTIIAIAFLGSLSSCGKDALDPTLAQEKDVATSINTVDDLQGLLLGAYNRITTTSYYGRDVIIIGTIRADESFSDANSGRFQPETEMDMLITSGTVSGTWAQIYAVIASANILIGTDVANITGDAAKINHIIGQAYALRALGHYDLLRIYGQQHVTGGNGVGIPYVKTYKGGPESLLPTRNTVAECKQFIMEDLATAASLMSNALNDPSKQYMTTYGAKALAARVALYFEDWATAKTMANDVITSGAYSICPADQYAAFWSTDGGVNSIFELAYSGTDNNNINGLSQIFRGNAYGDIRALPELLDIFDDNDVRGGRVGGKAMIDWDPDPTKSFKLRNMGKYPSADYSDNIPLIRYEEVILIYAEASLETGAAGTALTYLNMLTSKRNANPYTVATKANILKERKRELVFEGFRFDDLARTHSSIPLISPLQAHGGPAYGSYKYAFPIPQAEMLANSNMTQNVGFTN